MRRLIVFSALAMAGVAFGLEFKEERNISYHSAEALAKEGAYAANRCKVDVRWPVGATNFATVVNIHGGGLVAGGKHYAPWPKEAKDQDPVAFVGVGYRLITNATPEQCISDAAAAVAWTIKNISRYGGDPKKVFVTGISGGGYLTAMVGLDPKWLAPHGLKPTDLGGIAPLTGQMTKHFNVRKVSFKDNDPQFLPKIDAWAPLAYASTNALPPSCFLTGGRDVEWKSRVEENELLAVSLKNTGHKDAEFHETEGDHGGGVKPSSYFLRDFVLKTCDTGAVGAFAPGERVVFFGDSITHGGRYVGYLQLFAALRHPGWSVRCINAGIGGDSAGGGIGRWQGDVMAMKPDRVFTMFGMNDVGRDNYKTLDCDEKTAAARARALEHYEANNRRLADMMPASGVKTVFITPSPFDQYSQMEKENLAACNDPGLAACANIIRKIAGERNFGVVDFHAPMTELLKKHPELHLCGPDRVHPGAAGHLIMAALVLDAMHVPALVARASIDAAKGKADKIRDGLTENAVVTAVRRNADGGVSFTYAPKALPFPKLPEYEADEKIYPLTEKLNREEIVVKGLKPGRYALSFDGVKVGSFTDEDLAKGVNVALLATPNQARAQATAKLVAELVVNEGSRRNLELNYVRFRRAKIALDDWKAQDAWLDKMLADMKAAKSPWYQAHVGIAASYRKQREHAAEYDAKAEELYERINAVRPAVEYVTVTREGDR